MCRVCVSEGQRTTSGSQFSPFAVGSSDQSGVCVASALTRLSLIFCSCVIICPPREPPCICESKNSVLAIGVYSSAHSGSLVILLNGQMEHEGSQQRATFNRTSRSESICVGFWAWCKGSGDGRVAAAAAPAALLLLSPLGFAIGNC